MRCLIVEDNFHSRQVLGLFLKPYATCDFAMDGYEAVSAYEVALKEKNPYRMVTLDIMMPKSDGQEALKEIRELEALFGMKEQDGAKIIMISALDDPKTVMDSLKDGATSFLTKPINRKSLYREMENLGLIESKEK